MSFRNSKLVCSIIFLLLSIYVVYNHAFELSTTFIILTALLTSSVVFVYSTSASDFNSVILFLIMCIGVVIPVGILIGVNGMIGIDPDKYALWIQRVAISGSISEIGSPFYRKAPLMILLTSIVSIVLDSNAISSSYIFPIMYGAFLPLIGLKIISNTYKNPSPIEMSSSLLLLVLTAGYISFSTRQISQTLSHIYILLSVLILSKPATTHIKRHFFVYTLMMVSIFFTHKAGLVFVCIPVALIFIYSILFERGESIHTLTYLFVPALLLYIQWFDLSSYGDRGLYFILSGVGAATNAATGSVPMPEAAVANSTLLVTLFYYGLSIITILSFGGLAWIWYIINHLQKDKRRQIFLIPAFTSVLVFITLVSYISGALNPQRVLIHAEPLLPMIIVPFIYRKLKNIPISGIIFALLITSQLFSGTAMPNSTQGIGEQKYLSSEDISTIDFYDRYVQSPTFADRGLMAATPSDIIEAKSSQRPDRFRSYPSSVLDGDPRLNKEIDVDPCAIHREDRTVYRASTSSTWRLTWDLKAYLHHRYSSVYDSGKNSVYC